MASMPRIITVDPSWAISRVVRSAMDLMDRPIIQVDVLTGADALEELSRGCNLVVTAFALEDMKAFELAMRVKQSSPETSVLIFGDVEDPDDEEFEAETNEESPFVYLSRPVDIHKFLRVLVGGMENHDAMVHALKTTGEVVVAAGPEDMGPVPNLDLDASQRIIDGLLTDLGAMAIIVSSRSGEVLLERGAVGYIDRERLTSAMLPSVKTNISVKDLVGGQVSSIQFFDGEDYDVFVLSVGLHHFMCIMFDGQMGSRQFGGVNRFGRKAVEELIALLGAEAFFFQPTAKKEEPAPVRARTHRPQKEEEGPIELERAAFVANEAKPEPELGPQLEAIDDNTFEAGLDALFGGDGSEGGGDLFDESALEELAKQNTSTDRSIDIDQAMRLGLINNTDA
jgi:CheY-like chemotaxis protein